MNLPRVVRLHGLGLLLAGLVCGWLLTGCRTADPARDAADIAQVRAAFATLQEYQRTDDLRTLDLFMRNGSVTVTAISTESQKTRVMPVEKFRQLLAQELAEKRGSNCAYEDVRYANEGADVRVTGIIRYTDSDKRAPFSALYRCYGDGVFKIYDLKVTIFAREKVEDKS